MPRKIRSLITSSPESGIILANELAEGISSHWEAKAAKLRVGGTNYGLSVPSVAPEVVSSILFYAVSIANRGWEDAPPPPPEEVVLPKPPAFEHKVSKKKK